MFLDADRFTVYNYSPERADVHWQRYHDLQRIHLAVMPADEPIGEIVLKNIDPSNGCCTIGIHLQNDRYKNKGYGTEAEIQAMEYTYLNWEC